MRRLEHPESRIASFVRVAIFNDWLNMGGVRSLSYEAFLERATQLTKVYWLGSYHIPQAFLDVLERKFPNVYLELEASIPDHEYDWYRGWGLYDELQEMKGSGSSCLRELKLSTYFGQREQKVEERVLSSIIKNSPNLKVIHNASDHCSYRRRRELMTLKLQESDILPQLNHLHFLTLKQTDYEIWVAQDGLKNLKSLAVHSLKDLAPFQGHVPHLQHFTLLAAQERLEESIQSDTAFVDLGPLQTLQLYGCFGTRLPLKSIISYKESLTDLRIHSENDIYDNPWAELLQITEPLVLTESEIPGLHSDFATLNRECQKLERLHLDFYIPHDRWMNDEVKALFSMNNLSLLIMSTGI